MKRIVAVLALVPLTVAASATAQEPSPEQMKQLLGFLSDGFAEMKPSKGIVPEVADEKNLPLEMTAAGIKKGFMLYQQSFHFSVNASGSALSLESEPLHVPGSQFMSGQLRWETALTSDKKNVLDKKTVAPASRMQPLKELEHGQVALASPTKKRIERLEGQLTVRYPTHITSAEFNANETNQEKTLQTASCGLLGIENDLVTIHCTGKTDDIEIFPLSGKGMVLDISQSMVGPTLIYREMKKSGKLPPTLINKMIANPSDLGKEGRTWVLKAKGKVAKVMVINPIDHRDESLKILAFPQPDFTGKTCPAIPSPQFAPLVHKDTYSPLNETQVRQGTAIVASRSNAMIGFNNQVILFQLPSVPNSTLATLQVKDLILKKGRAPVAFEAQGPFQDRKAGFMRSFRMEPSSGDQPVDYDTASGKAVVHYPTQISTRKVLITGDDPVVKIQGCQVRRYGDLGNLEQNTLRPTLRAYDKEGRILQLIKNYSSGGLDNLGPYSEVRFWGEIAWVEVDEVKQWKDLKIPFSLKPAPMIERESSH